MKMKLVEKRSVAENVISFIFEPAEPLSWQPGQYMHYTLPHPDTDDRGVQRWFTISAAPFERHAMVTTRFDNEKGSTFKKALRQLEVGDEVEVEPPRGDFLLQGDDVHYILIAGGIGITPYRSMLLQADHDGKDLAVELMYANRDENLVFGDELSALEQRHPKFHLHRFIGDQKIDDKDLAAYKDEPNVLFYISGPRPMVESYQHALEAMGVYGDKVKTDYFPGY